jgi:ribosomal protein L11 methylase PrmA
MIYPTAFRVNPQAFRESVALVVSAFMAACVTAGLVAVSLYLFFFVFFPIARGAIYDPSSRIEAEAMARLAEVRPGEKAADLGSGDGRVVCALARGGAEAHGYEINPVLVLISRRNIRREGLSGLSSTGATSGRGSCPATV